MLLAGLSAGVYASFPADDWISALTHTFTILVIAASPHRRIAASAWLLATLVEFVTDLALEHHRVDVPDNLLARRLRSRTLIVRRLAIAIIVIVAIGATLLTSDSVRALGASVLASAGIASIVAGLAAQSLLANMFAGIQLVFGDALRVDDVIVAEGKWGRVGEITLSYVVLDLWDGRASVLQVTEATVGVVRVRILVTAADAPTLYDLRGYVREAMVLWVQSVMPDAAPAQRVLVAEPSAPRQRNVPATSRMVSRVNRGMTPMSRGMRDLTARGEAPEGLPPHPGAPQTPCDTGSVVLRRQSRPDSHLHAVL